MLNTREITPGSRTPGLIRIPQGCTGGHRQQSLDLGNRFLFRWLVSSFSFAFFREGTGVDGLAAQGVLPAAGGGEERGLLPLQQGCGRGVAAGEGPGWNCQGPTEVPCLVLGAAVDTICPSFLFSWGGDLSYWNP